MRDIACKEGVDGKGRSLWKGVGGGCYLVGSGLWALLTVDTYPVAQRSVRVGHGWAGVESDFGGGPENSRLWPMGNEAYRRTENLFEGRPVWTCISRTS